MASRFLYNNVKNRTREQSLNLEHLRHQTSENIKEKAKKQIEKNKIVELNVGDHVRVKMSALYSEIRKAVKQGNKKLINVTYTPEIYRDFKVFEETHPSYERKGYTLKFLDGQPLYSERKVNEMTHSHRYRRLFASDLLKVDKDTKNLDYTNYRANQLNRFHKLVIEKPKGIKEKVVRQEKDNTIQEEPNH